MKIELKFWVKCWNSEKKEIWKKVRNFEFNSQQSEKNVRILTINSEYLIISLKILTFFSDKSNLWGSNGLLPVFNKHEGEFDLPMWNTFNRNKTFPLKETLQWVNDSNANLLGFIYNINTTRWYNPFGYMSSSSGSSVFKYSNTNRREKKDETHSKKTSL